MKVVRTSVLFLSIISFYFIFLVAFNIYVISKDPVWNLNEVPWIRGGLLIVAILGSLFIAQVSRWFRSTSTQTFLRFILLVLPIAIGLLSAKDLQSSFVFFLFLICCFFLSEFGAGIVGLLWADEKPVSRWVSFLVTLILLHHLLFVLMKFSLLTVGWVATVVAVSIVIGICFFIKNKSYKKIRHQFNEALSTDLIEIILINLISFILVLTYITGQIPQTMSDSVVYRIPTLIQMKEHGEWPFHFWHWFRMTPQPFMLLLYPSFLLAGVKGAMWLVWIFSFVLVFIVKDFVTCLCGSRKMGYFTCLILLTASPFWVISTAIYSDYAITAFSLGGIFLVWQFAESKNSKYWMIGIALLTFALTIKLNAPLIFIPFLFLVAMLYFREFLKIFTDFKILGISISVFSIVFVPWFYSVFKLTGNPLFPFLGYFSRPEFSVTDVMTPEAIDWYGLKLTVKNIVLLPWSISFFTGRFGEYLHGTLGIGMIFFLGVVIIFAVQKIFTGEIFSFSKKGFLLLGFISISFFTLILVSIATKVAVLRYWHTGFGILLIALASSVYMLANKAFSLVTWQQMKAKYLILVVPVFLTAFLLVFGTRMNYEVPGGLGWSVYTGKISEADFINSRTGGIETFVNRKLGKDETVAASGFTLVHLLSAQTFYISSANALFGRVQSLAAFESFLKQYNVRYWIADQTWSFDFLKGTGIVEKYLNESRVVYGFGQHTVYDLKRVIDSEIERVSKLEKVTSKISFLSPWTTKYQNDLKNKFLRFLLDVRPTEKRSIAILEVVFYNNSNSIVGRVHSSRDLKFVETSERIALNAIVPEGATHFELVLRPWRDIDGDLSILSGEIKFFN